jgi:hypothetical protein
MKLEKIDGIWCPLCGSRDGRLYEDLDSDDYYLGKTNHCFACEGSFKEIVELVAEETPFWEKLRKEVEGG